MKKDKADRSTRLRSMTCSSESSGDDHMNHHAYIGVNLSAADDDLIFTCDTSDDRISQTSQYGTIALANILNDTSGISSSFSSNFTCDAIMKRWDSFSLKRSITSFVPLVQRMHGYSLKRDLIADIIAGITIAILQVPQALAYALLVGVAPAYGLYTSIFPVSD